MLQRLPFSVLDTILIAVVTFFMLLDGKRPWRFCLQLFPESLQHLLPTAIQQNFLGFFWGRFLLSVFFGVLIGAKVAGLFSIFLAIPVTGILVILLNLEELQGQKMSKQR